MMEKYLNPGAFPGKVNNVIRYIEYNLQEKIFWQILFVENSSKDENNIAIYKKYVSK